MKYTSKNRTIGKREFIRLVAKEAGFTFGDTKIILETMIDVFQRAMMQDIDVHIIGFGKLYLKHLKAHKAWDGLNKKEFFTEDSVRANFKLGNKFKEGIRTDEFKELIIQEYDEKDEGE